jgi:predicted RNase H-like HicB family nuclease
VVRRYSKTPGAYKYGVEVPALPGCFSDGRTRQEALENVKEAISLYLSALAESGRKSRELVDVKRRAPQRDARRPK